MKIFQQVGRNGIKGFLITLVMVFSGSSYAVLPIAECKTFLDDELELLCLQQSIAAKITDELHYYVGDARRDYSAEEVDFLSTRLISLSPDGTVNYETHTPRVPCYQAHFGVVCHPAVSTHFTNRFVDRILAGEELSDDDPELTYYEMKVLVSYGQAQVFLTKRRFSTRYTEIKNAEFENVEFKKSETK